MTDGQLIVSNSKPFIPIVQVNDSYFGWFSWLNSHWLFAKDLQPFVLNLDDSSDILCVSLRVVIADQLGSILIINVSAKDLQRFSETVDHDFLR